MLHRVATKQTKEIKRKTKHKIARRHNKEGGNHLEQESNRQKPMEDTDRWLHPVVDEQSLGERCEGETADWSKTLRSEAEASRCSGWSVERSSTCHNMYLHVDKSLKLKQTFLLKPGQCYSIFYLLWGVSKYRSVPEQTNKQKQKTKKKKKKKWELLAAPSAVLIDRLHVMRCLYK